MPFLKRLPLFATIAAVSLWTVGCQTPPLKQSEALTEPFTVQRGTTTDELIAHLGEPDDKYPYQDYSVEAFVWVYERQMSTHSRMIIAGNRDVLVWNPTTRSTTIVEEPVLQPETTTHMEVTKILVVGDKVVNWKRDSNQNRDVQGQIH